MALTAVLLALPAVTAQDGPRESEVKVERQVYLMGTRCRLTATARDRQKALAGLEGLIRILEAGEEELSTWRPQSRLSRLNRQPLGQPASLQPSLCRLFDRLEHWHRQTGGTFDPAIGRLIEAWDIRGRGRLASPALRQEALRNSGLQYLDFDSRQCTLTRRRNVSLDAGAFGKGEALDRAFQRSPQLGLTGWMADLGGQIGVWGVPLGGPSWTVQVAHPRQRRQPLLQLELPHGSLAVSGGSERGLLVDGQKVSHIIDPRDGRPTADRGSSLVWHPSGLVSDALSTALYVMGPKKGLEWAQARGIAACFLIPQEQGQGVERRCTPRLETVLGASLQEIDAAAR